MFLNNVLRDNSLGNSDLKDNYLMDNENRSEQADKIKRLEAELEDGFAVWAKQWFDTCGQWFEQGVKLYMRNIGVLFCASTLTVLFSAVTLGILAGPMLAGTLLMVFKLIDNSSPKPEIRDIFQGFEFFKQSFMLCFGFGLLSLSLYYILSYPPVIGIIGSLAAYLFTLVLSTILFFALCLIVDGRLSASRALGESVEIVKSNPVNLLVFGTRGKHLGFYRCVPVRYWALCHPAVRPCSICVCISKPLLKRK